MTCQNRSRLKSAGDWLPNTRVQAGLGDFRGETKGLIERLIRYLVGKYNNRCQLLQWEWQETESLACVCEESDGASVGGTPVRVEIGKMNRSLRWGTVLRIWKDTPPRGRTSGTALSREYIPPSLNTATRRWQ